MGAFAYAEALPPSLPLLGGMFAQVAVPESPIYVAMQYDPKSALNTIVGNYFFGVSLNEADRVCKIVGLA
jgi:hypothetical protein